MVNRRVAARRVTLRHFLGISASYGSEMISSELEHPAADRFAIAASLGNQVIR
jgi:hypothetical protein